LYKNESLRYPGSTLDLTTLSITFTEAFNGVADTTSTAILAVNEEYFTYVVATDYNGVVLVVLDNKGYLGTKDVTYANLMSGTSYNTSLMARSRTNSTNHITGTFYTYNYKISRNEMYIITSQQTSITAGTAYVYKNMAVDPINDDPLYELYADLSSNQTIFTNYGATVDGYYGYTNAISDDGMYITIGGLSTVNTNKCCLYVFKRDDINNTYFMYHDLSSNTTNVPGNINGNSYTYADLPNTVYYTYSRYVAITDDAEYIYTFGNHHSVGNLGCIIFKHNGSSYDFYQVINNTGVLNVTTCFSVSGDGKTMAFGGWKHTGIQYGTNWANAYTRMNIYIGILFYTINNVTNMYEETQYIEQFNLNYTDASNINNNYAIQGYLNKIILSYDGKYCLIAGGAIDKTGTGVHYGLAILYETNGSEYTEIHNLNKVGEILTARGVSYPYYWDTRQGSNQNGPNMMTYSDMSADGSYIVLTNSGYPRIILIFKRNQETGIYDLDKYHTDSLGQGADSNPHLSASGKYFYISVASSGSNFNLIKGEDSI
jgi:hypothetical protein